MKKFRLLLLDANIVIHLFEVDLWSKVVEKCEILLARTVAEQEARFYEHEGATCGIDLKPDIDAKRITIVDVEAAEVKDFVDQFGPVYLEKLDPGEAESLAYLANSKEECLICSADAIVFRVLAALHKSEQGRSLEEILDAIGLTRRMEWRFSKAFRLEWTKKGGEEMIRGLDRKPS